MIIFLNFSYKERKEYYGKMAVARINRATAVFLLLLDFYKIKIIEEIRENNRKLKKTNK